MSELLDKIRSRGYRQVVIRPHTFIEQRISDISALYPILERCSVQLRGWNFPHLHRRMQPHIDTDWIGKEFQWKHYLELWRFYQSGQFVHIAGIRSDWRDQSDLWPPANGWQPGAVLGIGDTVFGFTEIFEFAARLAFTDASDDFMHISVTLKGLKDRCLQDDDPGSGEGAMPYRATIIEYPYQVDVPRTELIARPSELAIAAAGELFKRFNWDPAPGVLHSLQEQLRASVYGQSA